MGFSSFGFLNFCYRLWRSKKFRKFVIGFGFLAFVLSTIISNTTFAAQSDAEFTTDTTIAILESYQRNVDLFVQAFRSQYGSNDTYTERFNQLFSALNNNNNYLYLRHYSTGNNALNCLVYGYTANLNEGNFNSAVTTNYQIDGASNSYMLVPSTRL